MQNSSYREQLRKLYQQEDNSEKSFIPARSKIDPREMDRLFRVCAYCRVSTDNTEQLSSYELQQAHYQQLVRDHPNWELKRIFADEGITGTSLKKRNEFNAMIAACRNGEYDLIVTKSVSRFARNLVDCISTVRMLKGLDPPFGILFETDNLYTLNPNTEFMLSFLATTKTESTVWNSGSVWYILTNERYCGNMLTWKTFTSDLYEHKHKKNRRDRDQSPIKSA